MGAIQRARLLAFVDTILAYLDQGRIAELKEALEELRAEVAADDDGDGH